MTKISLWVALLATILLTACSKGGSSSDDFNSFFLPAPSPIARCFEITSENFAGSQVPDGPDALGGIGDFMITNGAVTFIVDGGILGSRGQHHLNPTGGTLIDATFGGESRDQLNQIAPRANLQFTLPFAALEFEIIEDSGNTAALRVTGGILDGGGLLGAGLTRDPASGFVVGLEVELTYRLEIGANRITVDSVYRNLTGVPVPVFTSSFIAFLGGRSMRPFLPFPARGTFHPTAPIASLPPAVVPALGLIGSTEDFTEINYAVCSPESGVMLSLATASEPSDSVVAAFGNLGTPGTTIAPTDTLEFSWTLIVGTPELGPLTNGAAPSLGAAYRLLAERSDSPSNIITSTTGRIAGQIEPALKGAEVIFLQQSPALFTSNGLNFTDFNTVVPGAGIAYSQTYTTDNGTFVADLPPGVYDVIVDPGEGRPQSTVTGVTVVSFETVSVGAIDLLGDDVQNVPFVVRDFDTGLTLPAKVVVKGVGGTLDPNFSKFQRTSGHQNIAYTSSGSGTLALPPGTYDVYFSHGTEWEVVVATVTTPSAGLFIEANLTHVVDTFGALSADFHVHTRNSFDSSVSPQSMLTAATGENVEVVYFTDHNNITDGKSLSSGNGFDSFLHIANAVEATSNIGSNAGFPGTPPRPIGHWIALNQRVRAEAGGNGAPLIEFIRPANVFDLFAGNFETVFDITENPIPGLLRGYAAVPILLAHPRAGLEAGLIPIGFFNAFGYNPTLPLTNAANTFLTAQNPLAPTSTRDIDFNMIEVLNGNNFLQYSAVLADWFSLLRQGVFRVAVGCSDSHSLGVPIGYPRSYVQVLEDEPTSVEDGAIISSILNGKVSVSNGPYITANIGTQGVGDLFSTGTALTTVTLDITVQAPSWVDTDTLNIYRNGVLISTNSISSSGVVRFSGPVVLNVDPAAGDSFYVVEASGSATTTYSIINPGGLSLGFTNALFVDENGDGIWTPPGL